MTTGEAIHTYAPEEDTPSPSISRVVTGAPGVLLFLETTISSSYSLPLGLQF